ncbi:MAG: hypothetical protein ACE5JX_20920, partial [Acidobacteriota bacterium]
PNGVELPGFACYALPPADRSFYDTLYRLGRETHPALTDRATLLSALRAWERSSTQPRLFSPIPLWKPLPVALGNQARHPSRFNEATAPRP